MIVIANEFFDALPVRHYIHDGRGWCERLIGLSPEGKLCFGLAAEPDPEIKIKGAPGLILEVGLAAQEMMGKVAGRLARDPGALLALDYGASAFRFGETLQALRHHQYADPLKDPGQADLTAHVDFSGLARAAVRAGASSYGPVTQGRFLSELGIFDRAEQLARNANPKQKQGIALALDRLVRDGPASGAQASMGELFKVLSVTSPGLHAPPGFEATKDE
jgi:SAM-dependent MidA family methyltransferase